MTSTIIAPASVHVTDQGVTTVSKLSERIRAISDIDVEVVPIPQWQLDVEVRGMTGEQRAAFVQRYADNEGRLDFASLYPELIIAGTFDPEDGSPVFSDEDREWLMSKSGAALETISAKVMRLSGLAEKAVDEVGKS